MNECKAACARRGLRFWYPERVYAKVHPDGSREDVWEGETTEEIVPVTAAGESAAGGHRRMQLEGADG